jgi:two-component system sensor histidine kinase KdpD
VPAGELVSAVLSDLSQPLSGRDVRVELPPGLPPVDADVVLITRVLANLVHNAVRHGPPGTPITIRARQVSSDTIELSVTDHGRGVDPARREEIFELFARRDDDAGAGLGLTIAKTFVEAHGQHIWVEKAPEGGARFCFTLPVAAPIPEEVPLAASARH